jgi:hypothetical protein
MLGQEESLFYSGDDGEKRAAETVAGDEDGSPGLKGGLDSAGSDAADGDQKVSAKFLITNASAGSVIGKVSRSLPRNATVHEISPSSLPMRSSRLMAAL